MELFPEEWLGEKNRECAGIPPLSKEITRALPVKNVYILNFDCFYVNSVYVNVTSQKTWIKKGGGGANQD